MSRRTLAPIAVLLGGGLIAGLLLKTGPTVEQRPPVVAAPIVRVLEVTPSEVRLSVSTHGTVVPRTESDLVPEVSGRVTWASPSLVSGGFFAEGEPLLRIDPLDYDVALEQGRAHLARTESDLADARKDEARQMDLARRDATSDAQRDKASNRLRIAAAAYREAVASLERAQRDRARTEILAPYAGRVRSERVDVGQFVNRGTPIAMIYAVDFAEVRLPVPDEELAYLELPLVYSNDNAALTVPVELRARFAGSEHRWSGEVVRTEGELDPRTRMVNVVARVADPYAKVAGRPPLSVGLFVEAEIKGARVDGVVVLPRSSVRSGNRVLVVDDEEHLRFREVEVLRVSRDEVFVSGGLAAGERVCVSPLESPIEGMLVRVAESPPQVAATVPPIAGGLSPQIEATP